MSYWRRTAWGRASPRRRVVMTALWVVALCGMVLGASVWRPAALIGAGALIVFALVVVSTV